MKSLLSDAIRQELEDRLRSLRADSTRCWGRMTPHQMMCHCSDTFKMASGERPVVPKSKRWIIPILKYGALYLPIPWPRGFRTRRELDQQRDGTPPAEFESDRTRLLELMQAFSKTTEGFGQHALFGPLTHWQWMRWAYLHTDHHLRQFGC